MIPLLVWPQEQRLRQILNRVLVVLEEQDLYALPGDMRRRQSDHYLSWNATVGEDDDDDDDDLSLLVRRNGHGDSCSTTIIEQEQEYDEQQQGAVQDGNGNEIPIIVIRPVARRPRQQRRNYIAGTRRSRKVIDGIGLLDGGKEGEFLKTGYRNLTQCSSQNELQASRSRSRSPPVPGHYHRRHSNSIGAASRQTTCQFPPVNN